MNMTLGAVSVIREQGILLRMSPTLQGNHHIRALCLLGGSTIHVIRGGLVNE